MKIVIMISLSSDFISIATLWTRYCYLCLTDKKMDAQRRNKNCLRPFIQVVKLEVILVYLVLRPSSLCFDSDFPTLFLILLWPNINTAYLCLDSFTFISVSMMFFVDDLSLPYLWRLTLWSKISSVNLTEVLVICSDCWKSLSKKNALGPASWRMVLWSLRLGLPTATKYTTGSQSSQMPNYQPIQGLAFHDFSKPH